MLNFLIETASTLISAFIIFICVGLLSTESSRLWLYKQILKLYPKQHRADFGDEMIDDFCRRCREQENGLFGLMHEFWDAIQNASYMQVGAVTGGIVKYLDDVRDEMDLIYLESAILSLEERIQEDKMSKSKKAHERALAMKILQAKLKADANSRRSGSTEQSLETTGENVGDG